MYVIAAPNCGSSEICDLHFVSLPVMVVVAVNDRKGATGTSTSRSFVSFRTTRSTVMWRSLYWTSRTTIATRTI